MKRIGKGLQFIVYDKENGKVLKIPTSKLQIKLRLIKWHPLYLIKFFELEKYASRVVNERTLTIEKMKTERLDSSLFANLKIEKGHIEQDKVIPLGKIINKNPRKLIDRYIDFILNSWKSGFSDRTYNFTINNGINKEGRIVLIDFGEITFNKDEVKKAILSKRWRRSWSFNKDLQPDIKEYYDKQMEKRITLANINKKWKVAPVHAK